MFKKKLFGKPAGPIVNVCIAKRLMQYSEIALSALHLEKVITKYSWMLAVAILFNSRNRIFIY